MINKIVDGDLLQLFKNNKFDAIVHGCNCHCNMGGGIAKYIKKQFPKASNVDNSTAYGDLSKLGTYSKCSTEFGDIINGYTQFNFFGAKVLVEYDAVEKLFKKLNEDYKGATIGIPKIGAGLAGGDWNRIEKIINDNTPDLNIVLVNFVS